MLYNNSYLTYINVLGKPKNTIYEKLNEIIMRVIISYNNRHLKYIKVFIKKVKENLKSSFLSNCNVVSDLVFVPD